MFKTKFTHLGSSAGLITEFKSAFIVNQSAGYLTTKDTKNAEKEFFVTFPAGDASGTDGAKRRAAAELECEGTKDATRDCPAYRILSALS
jgi:hypothetical protein